jgi:hypothetical protein
MFVTPGATSWAEPSYGIPPTESWGSSEAISRRPHLACQMTILSRSFEILFVSREGREKIRCHRSVLHGSQFLRIGHVQGSDGKNPARSDGSVRSQSEPRPGRPRHFATFHERPVCPHMKYHGCPERPLMPRALAYASSEYPWIFFPLITANGIPLRPESSFIRAAASLSFSTSYAT